MDAVLQVYDTNTDTLTNVGLAVPWSFVVGGNIFAMAVFEPHQGNADLNGDLDDLHEVLHVGQIQSPVRGRTARVTGNGVSFHVYSSAEGNPVGGRPLASIGRFPVSSAATAPGRPRGDSLAPP